MKNALFILTFLFVLVFGSPVYVSAQNTSTTISFNELQYDFGDVKQGKNVSHSFAFQNTGTQPLIIKSAKGSCGCTVPKYSKKPIAPGQWSEILVTFKSANKDGSQTKTITINANTTPNPTRLTITANVLVGKQNLSSQSLLPNSSLQDATLPQITETPNTDPELKDAILLPELIETNPAIDAATMNYDNLPKTTIKFEENKHDFGDIKQGDKVNHIFTFKNTGTEPLIINSAKGSCGCTVPNYPKYPIEPGQKGEISVEFSSAGKSGAQTKTVTIVANTDPNPIRLTIKANINTPQNDIAEDLLTELQFEHTDFAFGTVAPNEQLIHTFKFKNVGDMPFILDQANCGCGCKVLKQPQHAIAPGKSGSIKIALDSTEKLGDLDKKLFISGNVPNNFYELSLSAQVAATPNIPETSTPEHTHNPNCVPPPPSKFRSNDTDTEAQSIRVYPTISTNGIVNISLPTDSSPAKISVFDMSGKMMMQNVLSTSGSIDLPNTAGNYIVQIETDALKVMRKVERY